MPNLCIIGCGLISRSHAKAIQAIAGARLLAVCDVVPEAAESLAREFAAKAYTGCEAMLREEKPDAAIICVPTYFHKPYTRLCAEHHVHVLCEKPLERTVPASEELIASVQASGIIFMTAQVVRFWPGYVQIKDMMDKGEIGDLYMASLRRASSRAGQYGKWLFEPELGGGAMHDMLVHDVDFLRYLCGPFKLCFANAVKDETGCYNHVIASIVHQNGARAIAEATMTMQTGYPFSFSILLAGTQATVEYRYSAGATIADRAGSLCEFKVWRRGAGLQHYEIENYDAYEKQLRYFLDCCAAGRQPAIVPHQDSLDVIRMIQAIHDSADSGEIVVL
jgi:predicted dehydrogenase